MKKRPGQSAIASSGERPGRGAPLLLSEIPSCASLEEVVAALAPQARAEGEEQKAVLREYLRGALREEDGALVVPGSSVRAKMWWRGKGERILG